LLSDLILFYDNGEKMKFYNLLNQLQLETKIDKIDYDHHWAL